jgi:hypothetical protein
VGRVEWIKQTREHEGHLVRVTYEKQVRLGCEGVGAFKIGVGKAVQIMTRTG